jgi:hypothetical protein
VHGTGVYSAGVGPKGPALERFLDIKKKMFFIQCAEIFLNYVKSWPGNSLKLLC